MDLARPRRAGCAALAVLPLALAGATSAHAAPAGVVTANGFGTSYIGSYKVLGGTQAQAIRSYGRPTSRVRRRDVCTARWTRIGLTIVFYTVSRVSPCLVTRNLRIAPRVAVATVSAARRWRTIRGLTVGQPFSELQRRYPESRRWFGTRWGLVRATRRPFSGLGVWWLSARVQRGRVTQLQVDGGRI